VQFAGGIPTVLDRFIQQLILEELQPLYERTFSPNSWGFRPERGAHDAVRAAQRFLIEEDKSWVVDMDIKGFLDPYSYYTWADCGCSKS
jgi:retron-type reverse transcriptase